MYRKPRLGRAAFAWLFLSTAPALGQGAAGATTTSAAAIDPLESGVPSGVTPAPGVTWVAPEDCPAPSVQLDELLGATSKHPLWGAVTITKDASGWHATLALSDAPKATADSEAHVRVLDGSTCEEVTSATLLIISITQREGEQPPPPLVTAPSPPIEAPQEPAAPKAGAPLPPPQLPQPGRTMRHDAEPSSPSTTVSLGAAGIWALWNGNQPALGALVRVSYMYGLVGLRAFGAWSTLLDSLPTTTAATVRLSSYDMGVGVCVEFESGVGACAGPTLQHIEVAGESLFLPGTSSGWFPGAALSLSGSAQGPGFGLWGELGTEVRFSELALDTSPQGEVARVQRASFHVWLGPQWRWR